MKNLASDENKTDIRPCMGFRACGTAYGACGALPRLCRVGRACEPEPTLAAATALAVAAFVAASRQRIQLQVGSLYNVTRVG